MNKTKKRLGLSCSMLLAAYYLARCGDHRSGRPAAPPVALDVSTWKAAYGKFFSALGDGRSSEQFRNSLRDARNRFDVLFENGRAGLLDKDGQPRPLGRRQMAVHDDWKDIPDAELETSVFRLLKGTSASELREIPLPRVQSEGWERLLMSDPDFFSRQFGLTERPFTLLPDPDFLFWCKSHQKAFSVLEYGVMTRAPIIVITGEVGAGKTTLLHHLLGVIEDDYTVGLISNASGDRGELLQWVLNALNVTCVPGASYVEKFQVLQDFLVDQYAQQRSVLLIIDEAQNLSLEGLEELRLLTNINSNKDELLQLIIAGQPELREMITRHELRQFAQRVVASYHIPHMDLETTQDYVRHRLRKAGGSGDEFTTEAVALIHRKSGGIPRMVNKLCDFGILYAVTSDMLEVDKEIVLEILSDGTFPDMS